MNEEVSSCDRSLQSYRDRSRRSFSLSSREPILACGRFGHGHRWNRSRNDYFLPSRVYHVDAVLILQQKRDRQSLLLSAEPDSGEGHPAVLEVCNPCLTDATNRLDVF